MPVKKRARRWKTFPMYVSRNSDKAYWELLCINAKELYQWTVLDLKKSITDMHETWLEVSGKDLLTHIWEIFSRTDYIYSYYKQTPPNIFVFMYGRIFYASWYGYVLKVHSYYYFRKEFRVKFDMKNILLRGRMTLRLNNIKEVVSLYPDLILEVFYNFLKTTALAAVTALIFFCFFINFFNLTILRQLGIWVIFGAVGFWLFSGFNFFLKRYRFAKFTGVVNRFWKRSNVYFWLVEGFLFALFFYYYLNSSQEPIYMYDFAALNQTHLPNLYTMYVSMWVLILCSYYFYYWAMNIPNFNMQQNIFHIFVVVLFFLYIYLNETYQFYYLLTYLTEVSWIYNMESNLWIMDAEAPRTRAKYQYLIFLLTAKYWHFVFIFLSLLFWSLKTFEQDKAHFTLSGYNLQNLVLLFWLNLIFAGQWLKWISRRFWDSVYFWFFTDSNFYYVRYLASECAALLIANVRHGRKKIPRVEWCPLLSESQSKEGYYLS